MVGMQTLNSLLDSIRKVVKSVMRGIAKSLNNASGGRMSPNTITLLGLAMHVPIAVLIASQNYYWAAGLLVVFGLFDTLDGELARLQKSDSPAGMLLDASTDRFKEVMLYCGVAFSFVALDQPYMAVWAVAACGASICVSYVKAKGETAVAKSTLSTTEVNRLFQDGFMRFELRMFLLVVGLLFNVLAPIIIIIAVLSALTATERLIRISRKL